MYSKNKFRTILRRFSDRPDYQELLIPLGVRLSEPSNFEFGIADQKGCFGTGNFAFNNGQTFNPGSGFVGTGLANTFDDAGVLFDEASSVSTNAYGLGGCYS